MRRLLTDWDGAGRVFLILMESVNAEPGRKVSSSVGGEAKSTRKARTEEAWA